MTDYIELSAAIEATKHAWAKGLEPSQYIEALPAADVAPVVRCKDCKHSWEDIGGLCCSHGACVDLTVPGDFYCAYGERKP